MFLFKVLTHDMLRTKHAFFALFRHRNCPDAVIILSGGEDVGLRPHGELKGMSVPFHEDPKLLGRSVCWPTIGKGEIGKVIRPMWEVKR